MIQTLFGEKIEQTQMFLVDGTRIPVTVIAVPDNTIVQVKTQEKDKYTAVQIGVGKKKKPSKPALGHAKKAGLDFAPYVIKEIKINQEDSSAQIKADSADPDLIGTDGESSSKVGGYLKIEEVFKPGDIVDVTGTSKGKGFAGVVKRHGFKGGPKTHGQSDRERAPGSIGQTTTPGRVYRGKRMAGRMGHEVVTVKNLKVVSVDEVNKKLYVAGLIPGVKNSIVFITRKGESKKIVPLYKEEPKEVPKEKEALNPVPDSAETTEPKAVEVKSEEKKKNKVIKADKKEGEEK